MTWWKMTNRETTQPARSRLRHTTIRFLSGRTASWCNEQYYASNATKVSCCSNTNVANRRRCCESVKTTVKRADVFFLQSWKRYTDVEPLGFFCSHCTQINVTCFRLFYCVRLLGTADISISWWIVSRYTLLRYHQYCGVFLISFFLNLKIIIN